MVNYVDPEAWVLLHIGNVVVRDRTHDAQPGGAQRGMGDKADGLDVTLSFGGYNTYGCRDLDVDFAAIAPLQLSWEITRLIWIGHIKGHDIGSTSQGEGDEGEAGPQVVVSPLSRIPELFIRLILCYSQPTLAKRIVSDEFRGRDEGDEVKEERIYGNYQRGVWRVI